MKTHAPVCPACGFGVFNRRYPKCERCGSLLPGTVAYSAEESEALRQRERAEELGKARQRKGPSTANDFGSSIDLGGGSGSCADGGGSGCD